MLSFPNLSIQLSLYPEGEKKVIRKISQRQSKLRLRRGGITLSLLLLGGFWGVARVFAVSAPRLSVVGVEINGSQQKEVPRGEILELIRGDRLRLLYATLQNTSRSPDLINFVGFWQANLARKGDDRDLSIDTSRLKKEWSLEKDGKNYRVEALTKGVSHGDIRIKVIEPLLKSIEVELNSQVLTVQPGQTIELRASDQIKVRALHTNHPRLDKEARVHFLDHGTAEGVRKVDLEVSHQDLRFAKVFLLVKP